MVVAIVVLTAVATYRVLRPVVPFATPSPSTDTLDVGTTSALNDVASATLFQPDWFSSAGPDYDISAGSHGAQQDSAIIAVTDLYDLADQELDVLGELLGSTES